MEPDRSGNGFFARLNGLVAKLYLRSIVAFAHPKRKTLETRPNNIKFQSHSVNSKQRSSQSSPHYVKRPILVSAEEALRRERLAAKANIEIREALRDIGNGQDFVGRKLKGSQPTKYNNSIFERKLPPAGSTVMLGARAVTSGSRPGRSAYGPRSELVPKRAPAHRLPEPGATRLLMPRGRIADELGKPAVTRNVPSRDKRIGLGQYDQPRNKNNFRTL